MDLVYNISSNDSRQRKEIADLVGAPFSMLERIKLGGIGSPRLHMTDCSPAIAAYMKFETYRNACNVEIRPQGVIVRFKSMLDTFGLVMPFRLLTIYQNGRQWSFHLAGEFIKMQPQSESTANRKFLLKLMTFRSKVAMPTGYLDVPQFKN